MPAEITWPPCLGACPHPGKLWKSPEGKRCPKCNAIIFPPKALALAADSVR